MNLYIAAKLKQRAEEETKSELEALIVDAIAVSFAFYFYISLICIIFGGME